MKLTINPTRMELLRLRRRLALARRGHKLLKDKLDGLVQRFLGIKKSYLDLHTKIEPSLVNIFLKSVLASALCPPQTFTDGLISKASVEVESSVKNIMGVSVPEYQIKTSGRAAYSELLECVELKEAVSGFTQILPELVKLASLSWSLRLLATQIIETRHRVNALEYNLIPALEQVIKSIGSKLAELERFSRVALIKIKKAVRTQL